MKKIILLVFIALLCRYSSEASHLMGGNFSVQWANGNTFHVTMNFYRDCTGVFFDTPSVQVGIYDLVTNNNVICFSMSLVDTATLQLADSIFTPPFCIQLGVYAADVVIPDNPNGYYISYSQCCRNGIITNITSPGGMGETIYIEIPDPALHNSSPKFKSDPHFYYFINRYNSEDASAQDADGDSLVYSLVTPLRGNLSSANSIDICPDPSPYPDAMWQVPYSLANVVGGTPPMSINPQTGIIFAHPPNLGLFAFAERVEEYSRSNGKKLGEMRRETVYNIVPCDPCNNGIDEHLNSPLSLFPNPGRNELRISPTRAGTEFKIEKIEIYNALGVSMKIVNGDLGKQLSIDVNDFNAGIYFIEITGAKERWVGKFVKE